MADARPAPPRRLYCAWLIRPFVFVCLTSLGLVLSGCAREVATVKTGRPLVLNDEPVKTAARSLILNDEQMDLVTAGRGNLTLDLLASAMGTDATSSTNGLLQTARSTILRVATVPVVRLIGIDPVDLIHAAGRAEATGSGGADCSATIVGTLDSPFLLLQAGSARITGTSALCLCGVFAIAPVAR